MTEYINRFGISHSYFLDLLEMSNPHEYADIGYYFSKVLLILAYDS